MFSDVTNEFKSQILELLKDNIDSAGTGYYIGLARSEPVSIEDNINNNTVASKQNQQRVRYTLQTVKSLTNSSYVVPAVEWEAEEFYEPYDNSNPDQEGFYVVNSEREVFLCINQGKYDDGSPIPTFDEPFAARSINTTKTFKTNDNYFWRYLYKISNLAFGTFKTRGYIPVKQITNNLTTIPEELEQIRLQDSSQGGEIIGIAIDSAGDNYSVPTVIVDGNGVGARFIADTFDNKIVNVRLDSNLGGEYLHGFNYDYARASIVDAGGGSGAKLRPILSPKRGINDDPVKTLKSKSLMLQTDIVGNEQDTILANNQFYQIAIFKDLKVFGGDSDFVGNTGNAMRKMILNGSSIDGNWFENDTFSNARETATAKIFYLDFNTLYYYQDEETGFGVFSPGDELINERDGTADVINLENPDVDPFSGDILYINTLENAITREDNQTEDVRIVIQLG